MLFIRKQISTVCLDAVRKVFSSPLLETRTAGWTPPNAGDSLDLPLSSSELLSFCLDFGTLHTLSINWKHLCTFKKWNNISTLFSISFCTFFCQISIYYSLKNNRISMILFPLTRHQRGVLAVKYHRPKSDLIHISFSIGLLKCSKLMHLFIESEKKT